MLMFTIQIMTLVRSYEGHYLLLPTTKLNDDETALFLGSLFDHHLAGAEACARQLRYGIDSIVIICLLRF
jgi:hypothetical protein